jgi:hypothetical protein
MRNHGAVPIDPQTIGSGKPRTEDGREYPEHLKAYEAFDAQLFPLLVELGEATPTEFAAAVSDPRLQTVVPRWMASAEWRSLIERTDRDLRSPRTYRATEHGVEQFES